MDPKVVDSLTTNQSHMKSMGMDTNRRMDPNVAGVEDFTQRRIVASFLELISVMDSRATRLWIAYIIRTPDINSHLKMHHDHYLLNPLQMH